MSMAGARTCALDTGLCCKLRRENSLPGMSGMGSKCAGYFSCVNGALPDMMWPTECLSVLALGGSNWDWSIAKG